MRPRQNKYNQKRRLLRDEALAERREALAGLARRVRYGGNPEHERNPGDFALTPPAAPRRAKSLCDAARIFERREALRLLRLGLNSGLVSDRFDGDWPCNVWAVTDGSVALEAQLEAEGVYHGYPMPADDPFRDSVLERWELLRD